VKVRFAGRDAGGFVLSRTATAEHRGQLAPLRRVVSAEPVLSAEIAELTARLAERYAGTRADLLRLAVPPRHAAVEKQPSVEAEPLATGPVTAAAAAAWADYPRAAEFLTHLTAGHGPRAVWNAAPGAAWPSLIAHAAATVATAGRGVVICLPDERDAGRVSAALDAVAGPGTTVRLGASRGPAERYRAFLAVSRGAVRIAVGTRSAAFAPVHELGLVVVWDDGDDLYAEPRAPYPHTREALLLRAEITGAGVLIGGFARSVEAARLVATGWAHELMPPRGLIRQRARVRIAGSSEDELARDPRARQARIPSSVHQAIRAALASGPVLLQTPRGGYLPSLACASCRAAARCRRCAGPLALRGAEDVPTCGWCGTVSRSWTCRECGQARLRATVVGGARTAEEVGRSFPGVTVRVSGGQHVLDQIDDERAVVVATPGAEPVAEAGYAAVVLLDTWLPLSRADLRASEEAARRWLNAAALVRSGGEVIAVGDAGHPVLQALVRWDPAGLAGREGAERHEARLPPAACLAVLSGDPEAVTEAVAQLTLPEYAEVLGPTPHGDTGGWRAIVRAPRSRGIALSRALAEVQRLRAARKLSPVRIQVDPPQL
jgi:primosomal protein N' (replication factor Y) (superfamily II helicase)